MAKIPVGAGVKETASGKLGKVCRQSGGTARGHLYVQFDGERERRTIGLQEVSYIAKTYEAAARWIAGDGTV
ncbi:MAG TPA: hypothetical protein VGH38_28755 [Bryobacteraceae bacterium]